MEENKEIAAESAQPEPRDPKKQKANGKKRDIKRMLSLKSTAIRVAFFSALVAVAALVFAAVLLIYLAKSGSENDRLRAEADREKTAASVKLNEAAEKKKQAEDALAVLQNELASMKTELSEKETELEALRAAGENTELKEEIEALKKQIAALEDEITAMESGAPLNLDGLLPCLQKLGLLLGEGAPEQTVSVEKTDEFGYKYYEDQLVRPSVAFAAVMLTKNYEYLYNAGTVYPSAGLRNLAYALAFLKAAEAEETRPEDMQNEIRNYDPEQIYVFTQADVVAGAGILKNAEEGAEYSFLELVRMSLQYSDATAAAVLEKTFGGELLSSFLASLGTTVMKDAAESVTLSDAVLLFRELYRYFRTGSKYALEMRSAMTSAVSTELSSVTSLPVAKRYGRGEGANHDMGIVLGDEPVIFIFLSDAKERSEEFSAYISSVEEAGLTLAGACR